MHNNLLLPILLLVSAVVLHRYPTPFLEIIVIRMIIVIEVHESICKPLAVLDNPPVGCWSILFLIISTTLQPPHQVVEIMFCFEHSKHDRVQNGPFLTKVACIRAQERLSIIYE